MKTDWWSNPFKRMVTFGESHTVGISATKREYGWASVLKELIDLFQHEPVRLINRGLGADIISRQCPLFQEYKGKRPIGIERYRKHVIEENPDLVIISYGYNDMRAGTPEKAFRADMQTVITDIKNETQSLVVLMDTYFIPGKGYSNGTGGTIAGSNWDRGSKEMQGLYNQTIRDLAGANDLLFASVYEVQEEATWTFCTPSGEGDIHANDLGHRLIAHRVFEVIAANCSCVSIKAQEERERIGKSPWRRGPDSLEAQLIKDFYPDSPYLTHF